MEIMIFCEIAKKLAPTIDFYSPPPLFFHHQFSILELESSTIWFLRPQYLSFFGGTDPHLSTSTRNKTLACWMNWTPAGAYGQSPNIQYVFLFSLLFEELETMTCVLDDTLQKLDRNIVFFFFFYQCVKTSNVFFEYQETFRPPDIRVVVVERKVNR